MLKPSEQRAGRPSLLQSQERDRKYRTPSADRDAETNEEKTVDPKLCVCFRFGL